MLTAQHVLVNEHRALCGDAASRACTESEHSTPGRGLHCIQTSRAGWTFSNPRRRLVTKVAMLPGVLFASRVRTAFQAGSELFPAALRHLAVCPG